MFPLSTMLKSFVKIGNLKVIDAEGGTHVFAGVPGPEVTMRLTDPTLYRKLFFNPELHAGEAYMDGRMSFPAACARFLRCFRSTDCRLGISPCRKSCAGSRGG